MSFAPFGCISPQPSNVWQPASLWSRPSLARSRPSGEANRIAVSRTPIPEPDPKRTHVHKPPSGAFIGPIVVGIGRSIDLAYAVAEERCDANEYTADGLLRTGVAEGESHGFNWGAAVVETLNLPTWSVPSDD